MVEDKPQRFGCERSLGSLFMLALALASCATYQDSANDASPSSAGSSGSDVSGPAGAGSGGLGASSGGAGSGGADMSQAGAGIAGAAASAGAAIGGTGGKTSSGGAAGNAAGSAGAGSGGAAAGGAGAASMGGGAGKGGAAAGGAAGSGSGGTAGSGTAGSGTAGSGTAGSGTAGSGTAGSGTAGSGTAGSGGGGTEHLLSEGKPVTADSEQTSKGNLAGLGNDGSLTTRWCAADNAVGHYWQVDLGASSTITKLHLLWEQSVIYKFKIEGSLDGSAWSSLLDQTSSSNANADQTYPLAATPKARWVRVTVTGLASSTTWASFYEMSVLGY